MCGHPIRVLTVAAPFVIPQAWRTLRDAPYSKDAPKAPADTAVADPTFYRHDDRRVSQQVDGVVVSAILCCDDDDDVDPLDALGYSFLWQVYVPAANEDDNHEYLNYLESDDEIPAPGQHVIELTDGGWCTVTVVWE